MAEEYGKTMDRIIRGARRTHPQWLKWYAESDESRDLVGRIQQVFETHGYVPSPGQFEQIQHFSQPKGVVEVKGPETERTEEEEQPEQEGPKAEAPQQSDESPPKTTRKRTKK